MSNRALANVKVIPPAAHVNKSIFQHFLDDSCFANVLEGFRLAGQVIIVTKWGCPKL